MYIQRAKVCLLLFHTHSFSCFRLSIFQARKQPRKKRESRIYMRFVCMWSKNKKYRRANVMQGISCKHSIYTMTNAYICTVSVYFMYPHPPFVFLTQSTSLKTWRFGISVVWIQVYMYGEMFEIIKCWGPIVLSLNEKAKYQ